MKKLLISALKIGIPLGLGAYLVWYFFDTLTEEEKHQIKEAVLQANYWWVIFATIPATLSHVSRAYRWKYTLEPLGYKPDSINSFFTVMIGYLVNLAVPRLGEISRCGYMNRYEKIPFDKLFGTVIAERIADLVMLISVITTVILIQYDLISDFVNEMVAHKFGNITPTSVLIMLSLLIVAGLAGLYLVYRVEWKLKPLVAVQNIIKGFLSGLTSILSMKNKGLFIAHTVFIWVMYYLMLYFNFFALEETMNITFSQALTAFVLGGLAMVVTNGGIGAYPLAIQAALSIYGYSEAAGGALGWITWVAQTLLVIVLGAGSMLLIPWYNKRKKAQIEVRQL